VCIANPASLSRVACARPALVYAALGGMSAGLTASAFGGRGMNRTMRPLPCNGNALPLSYTPNRLAPGPGVGAWVRPLGRSGESEPAIRAGLGSAMQAVFQAAVGLSGPPAATLPPCIASPADGAGPMDALALLEVRLGGLPAVRDRGGGAELVFCRRLTVTIWPVARLPEIPLHCLAFSSPEGPLPAAKVPPPLRP